MKKYIFVTGGVVSGLGKGLIAASIGRLLKNKGFKVYIQKFDPYLNSSPSSMDPKQHGEIFVTADGGETDLDLGHYERFIDENLSKEGSLSSGKVYSNIFRKEALGEFGGSTIQIIPHVTNEIINHLEKAGDSNNADIIITEIGGTVGDIESQPFLEAIRQFSYLRDPNDTLFVHLTLLPTIPISEELKSKPTQHSYRELMSYGIKPDILILRASLPIPDELKAKIARFCSLPKEYVIEAKNVDILYEVVTNLQNQGLDNLIKKKLDIKFKSENGHAKWTQMIERFKSATKEIEISLVGHDIELADAYISLYRALYDTGLNLGYNVKINWVNNEELYKKPFDEIFKNSKGIVLPGDIPSAKFEDFNKISELINYVQEKDIPFLAIGAGFDYLYTKLSGISPDNTIQEKLIGAVDVNIRKDNFAYKIYNSEKIIERFRIPSLTRYSNHFEENNGFKISATTKNNNIAIIENSNNKFFMAIAFHAEFQARPDKPHPIIQAFLESFI